MNHRKRSAHECGAELDSDSAEIPSGSASIFQLATCIAFSGEICPVNGSKFDFTEEKPLRSLVDEDDNIDIDNDFILRAGRPPGHAVSYGFISIFIQLKSMKTFKREHSGALYSPVSGIKMEISTSYPVIHFYGGQHLKCKGKKGEIYGSGKGLALEAQFHSAAVNYKNVLERFCTKAGPLTLKRDKLNIT
ncbi:hypothetical protein DICVIV_03674 [Dictyocaulus viviparus]|uniref:Uncharacterized protein n=1 Tax=Dictyocaulus viviparus TaxID=29172 RepID=A0A0D8Y6E6_DICVI|nr:hypothetical protein DICVIV_03674 [Dictyocaulus viviparus]